MVETFPCPVPGCPGDCVRFIIPGNPFPKERPKVGNGRGYTPKATVEYEKRVAAAWPTGMPRFEDPVRVDLWFDREDNRSADLDNLIKSILDGLNGHRTKDKTTNKFTHHAGVGYTDDKQVHEVHATVRRKVGKGNGCTWVHISPHLTQIRPADWWGTLAA